MLFIYLSILSSDVIYSPTYVIYLAIYGIYHLPMLLSIYSSMLSIHFPHTFDTFSASFLHFFTSLLHVDNKYGKVALLSRSKHAIAFCVNLLPKLLLKSMQRNENKKESNYLVNVT